MSIVPRTTRMYSRHSHCLYGREKDREWHFCDFLGFGGVFCRKWWPWLFGIFECRESRGETLKGMLRGHLTQPCSFTVQRQRCQLVRVSFLPTLITSLALLWTLCGGGVGTDLDLASCASRAHAAYTLLNQGLVALFFVF